MVVLYHVDEPLSMTSLRICASAVHVLRLFFFSSRRRHTRLQGDWSSDVCSSDLHLAAALDLSVRQHLLADVPLGVFLSGGVDSATVAAIARGHTTGRIQTFSIRSEERRVGKECRSRWSPYH